MKRTGSGGAITGAVFKQDFIPDPDNYQQPISITVTLINHDRDPKDIGTAQLIPSH